MQFWQPFRNISQDPKNILKFQIQKNAKNIPLDM